MWTRIEDVALMVHTVPQFTPDRRRWLRRQFGEYVWQILSASEEMRELRPFRLNHDLIVLA